MTPELRGGCKDGTESAESEGGTLNPVQVLPKRGSSRSPDVAPLLPSSFQFCSWKKKMPIFFQLRISMIGKEGWWVKVPVSAGEGKCRELRDTGVKNPS